MANKVYKKGAKVHPSPTATDNHLSLFLPAAILALAASLPIPDKQVLAYLLSCSSDGDGGEFTRAVVAAVRPAKEPLVRDHAPQFECGCFRCYVSFWSRWDSSPNRQVIHEIIEAFEDHQRRAASQRRVRQGRRGRKEWKKREEVEDAAAVGRESGVGEVVEAAVEGGGGEGAEEEVGLVERGLVRRIGTSIGYKIWNFLDRITM